MQINTNYNSPNFAPRKTSINFIIIHYTDLSFELALETLTSPSAKVSAHYLIKNNGQIYQLVAEEYAAWHAGRSAWGNEIELNESSIGIELDNLGWEDYPLKQLEACKDLCLLLSKKYNIPQTNIIGHSDIAPTRKIDPGVFFDWSYLAQHNLAIWHNIPIESTSPKALFTFGDKGTEILTLQTKLKKFGYPIILTGELDIQTSEVIRAFQSRFYPQLIRTKGENFYRNLNSRYNWDNLSNQILLDLLDKIK